MGTEVIVKKVPQTSNYIGVSYNERTRKWTVRRSKNEKKTICNGHSYEYEETAAHASDTLARELIAKGEQNHELNFPHDNTQVHPEKKATSSRYIGVCYNYKSWAATRWSKTKYMRVYNGKYKDEEAAAHASDTLARQLMASGEQNHELNFPDDTTEVYPKKKMTSSHYFGVSYTEKYKTWAAARWSKNEKKLISKGYFKDEKTAALASDNLARKLMENGDQNHKMNFPQDKTEESERNKRKRSSDEDLVQNK